MARRRPGDEPLSMPRSHQTRSQYVLQNVAKRGQTVCEQNESCDNCLQSFYELNGRFMDAVDGLEREGHSKTSRLLKIPRRPSRSEIGRSDNVLKTRWTFYERNCRTSDLLGTHYNVVQSSISYSTPFAKSNGRFFSDTKLNMMPLSNLYNFWWVHKMHASVHFLCKIY